MSQDSSRMSFSSFFPQSQFQTQAEVLEVKKNSDKLVIGIPKEYTIQECRVPLVPNSVIGLVGEGHRIIIESGAGIQSNFTDHDYSEAGAEIVDSKEEVYKATVILKVAPPTLEDLDLFHSDQILISPLQIPTTTQEYIEKLISKRITAVAMEYLQAEDGSFPVVRIMSEIAGMSAMLTAAELLSNSRGGRGVLLGGVSGVPPAKVVILGAGIVAEFAIRTALGLGAEIRVFDNNVHKIMRLKSLVGRHLNTSTFNPVHLRRQLVTADAVIGAMHSKTGRTKIVVTEDLVRQMKPRSVIIDVSIDQGGCFETSRVTSHDHPTFVMHDVIHYCVPNIPSKMPRTASIAFSNIITPILQKAGDAPSVEQIMMYNPGFRHGVYTYKGCLTNEYLSRRFDVKYTDLDLLMASQL